MSEDLLVDEYDYNPHTCMVEVPYNDYWYMKDKCKENKQLKDQLQQKENIIKEVINWVKITIDNIEQQPTGNDEWILERLNGFLWILEEENK